MTKSLVTPVFADLVTVIAESLRPSPTDDPVRRPCECPEWMMLTGSQQDRILDAVMRWACQRHAVDITLAAHGNTVAIRALRYQGSRQGDAGDLMVQLCLLADCAAFTMRWVPVDTVEVDLAWQVRVFGGVGFVPTAARFRYLGGRACLVREPVAGRSHGRP